MSGTFLQTSEWAEFQRALGHKVFVYDENNIKALIVRRDIQLRKNYLYIAHGPEIDFNSLTGGSDNAVRSFVQYLRTLAKEQKSIFVRAEPLFDSVAQALIRAGFKKSKYQLQPSKTVVNDLTKTEEELLAGFSHGTRYSLRVAQKNNISMRESDQLEVFLQLLECTTQRQKFGVHPRSYYEKLFSFFRPEAGQPRAGGLSVKLFIAESADKPLAAALVLIQGETAYYLHGASDYAQKNLRAPSLLHWEIMRQLKAEGIKFYDWWGIDSKKWPGVTEFKLGWGGRVVEHPGAFDLPISSFWYWIYKLVK